ncbi:hypothetical protein [Streptomyces litmocidini]|uniref:Alcohol dehydrogenase-like C-terminal domain-containing protein n=1 Tax=Streptomyces litmocidini TaxID=67318 RepID=A0ABW7U1Z6_9ACTN
MTTGHPGDAGAALTRTRELLRPGGTSVVVGLARDASATERAVGIGAAPVVRITEPLREGTPVTEPEMNYGQVRAEARRLLPGVRHRRHLLRRYSLIWERTLTRA